MMGLIRKMHDQAGQIMKNFLLVFEIGENLPYKVALPRLV